MSATFYSFEDTNFVNNENSTTGQNIPERLKDTAGQSVSHLY